MDKASSAPDWEECFPKGVEDTNKNKDDMLKGLDKILEHIWKNKINWKFKKNI